MIGLVMVSNGFFLLARLMAKKMRTTQDSDRVKTMIILGSGMTSLKHS